MSRAILFCLLFLTAIPVTAQSAEDLYQQALRVERVSSNPEAAIALYRQIVELPDADRTLMARAWLQIGKAFEVLGQDGAVAAYSRVVRDFADVRDVAGEASERMANLSPADLPEPSSRTVLDLAAFEEFGAVLSPSGRLLAYSPSYSYIEIVEVATAKRRRIDLPLAASQWVDFLAFSPDESQIATVINSSARTGGGPSTITMIDVETGQLSPHATIESLFARDVDFACGEGFVQDWSQDGDKLLLFLYWKEGECSQAGQVKTALAIVPIPGGPVELLPDVEDDAFSLGATSMSNRNACFSADGRYVLSGVETLSKDAAYIRRFEVGDGSSEIWRRDGEETVLYGCTWSPGAILYARRESGGVVLRAGSANTVDAGADEVVAVLDESAWAAAFSKQGDFALEPMESGAYKLLLADVYPINASPTGASTTIESAALGQSTMQMSPTGMLAWTAGPKDVIHFYDTEGRRRLDDVPLRGEAASSLLWVDETRLLYRTRSQFEPETPSTGPQSAYIEGPAEIWNTVVLDMAGREVAELSAEKAREVGIQWAVPLEGQEWLGWLPSDGCWGKVDVVSGAKRQMHCPSVQDLRRAPVDVAPSGDRALTWLWDGPAEKPALGILDLKTGKHRALEFPREGRVAMERRAQWLSSTQVVLDIRQARTHWNTENPVILDVITGDVVMDLSRLVSGVDARFAFLTPDRRAAVLVARPSRLYSDHQIAVVHNILGLK